MKAAGERNLVSPVKQSIGPALAVDLDGTLVKTDLLLESLLALLKQKSLYIFALPIWLLKGLAYFKQQVARRVLLDVSILPYREELLDYLKTQRARGRTIVLATACDMQIARQVSDHLKLFDLVLASDGTTNLSGKPKRDRLVQDFGEKGFDYVGDHRHDLVVWASAREAMMVNSRPVGTARAAKVNRVFEDRRRGLADYLKPLRLQHWMKNVLVFIPLLTAHRFYEIAFLGRLLLAFLALGCLASSGYLVNDLLDLQADRHHPSKRFRSFAAGDLPLSYALRMIPALAFLGCVLSAGVSRLFLGVVLIYFVLTLTYSLYLKKIVILDVIVLASLYSIRLMAGAAAVAIWPSQWLVAFSTFLFFSLALVKRYGELVLMRGIEGDRAKARCYETGDEELLAAMGIASGYLAVLVLALYINSDTARILYGRYQLIWLLCPLMFYWISHFWLIAHRGKMPDDPVVFAMSDRTSRILGLLMLTVTILAL